MRQFFARLALAVAFIAPAVAGAQAAPAAPVYNVLTVYRETVKPGKGTAHDAHEVAWAGAVAAANPPNAMLAMTAMSGAPESWYMSVYPSWAAYEKANKASDASAALTAVQKQYSAAEGDYLSDARGMVLTFRDDLSFMGPDQMAASRYMSVTRISVRPGHSAEFEANRKLVKAAHMSARLTDYYSVWQAASGAPAGTYFLMVARKSLAELDEGAAMHGSAAYLAALGGEEGQKRMTENAAAAIISSQVDLFAFAPQQSVPPPEWISADPAFWKHKPAAKKTP